MSDKLDFSKPDQLQTRDGRQVRIYATDGSGSHPIHGAVLDKPGWIAAKWMECGFNHNSIYESPYDLVPKPARVTGWMNVYPEGVTGKAWADRGECKKNAGIDCLGQIYIDAEIQR